MYSQQTRPSTSSSGAVFDDQIGENSNKVPEESNMCRQILIFDIQFPQEVKKDSIKVAVFRHTAKKRKYQEDGDEDDSEPMIAFKKVKEISNDDDASYSEIQIRDYVDGESSTNNFNKPVAQCSVGSSVNPHHMQHEQLFNPNVRKRHKPQFTLPSHNPSLDNDEHISNSPIAPLLTPVFNISHKQQLEHFTTTNREPVAEQITEEPIIEIIQIIDEPTCIEKKPEVTVEKETLKGKCKKLVAFFFHILFCIYVWSFSLVKRILNYCWKKLSRTKQVIEIGVEQPVVELVPHQLNADQAPTRYKSELSLLRDMGFVKEDSNLTLLDKYNGDLQRVIADLVQ